MFEQAQEEIRSGVRATRSFVKDSGFLKADIVQGNVFILSGQTAYVAEVGKTFRAPNGEFDARLRVIYSNGTESKTPKVRSSPRISFSSLTRTRTSTSRAASSERIS